MVRDLIQMERLKTPYPASSWEEWHSPWKRRHGSRCLGDGEFETITLTQEHLYAPVREGLKPIPMGDCLLGIRGFWIDGNTKKPRI